MTSPCYSNGVLYKIFDAYSKHVFSLAASHVKARAMNMRIIDRKRILQILPGFCHLYYTLLQLGNKRVFSLLLTNQVVDFMYYILKGVPCRYNDKWLYLAKAVRSSTRKNQAWTLFQRRKNKNKILKELKEVNVFLEAHTAARKEIKCSVNTASRYLYRCLCDEERVKESTSQPDFNFLFCLTCRRSRIPVNFLFGDNYCKIAKDVKTVLLNSSLEWTASESSTMWEILGPDR